MKLATLDDGTRDGQLIVVNGEGTRYAPATGIAPTLQGAIDSWQQHQEALSRLSERLRSGAVQGHTLDPTRLLAPLPRAYEWVDASAYLNHVRLVRKARGAAPPPGLTKDPLVYQGGSGVLLGARSPVPLPDPEWGLDFEGEVSVVLADVPRGLTAHEAESRILLLMLANDLSYRNLIPQELAKGFGFFASKPATAYSPFAVTPDELGAVWSDGRVHGELHCYVNENRVGRANAGVGMHFSFPDLIAHIARTRAFTAGTILGSGTVSNEDEASGVSCIAELRARETVQHGAPVTPFLSPGDSIRIELVIDHERPLGSIEQEVVAA